MSFKVLDPEQWNRKEHYYFFKTFEEPFTGVIVDVNVETAYIYCKQNKISFFKYYLHKSIQAVNTIPAFKLRIVNDELRQYDKVNASATLSRTDGTFGFSFIGYDQDFNLFIKNVNSEMQRVQNSMGLFPPDFPDAAVVHYSALPWIKFNGLTHARKFSTEDSSPKISFGKLHDDWQGIKKMPVSIHVHHALADGKDIGEYIELFQELLDG